MTIIIQFNTIWLDNDSIMKAISAIALGEEYRLPSAKKEVKVNESVLEKYAGKYEMPNGNTITLERCTADLTVTPSDTNAVLAPCSETVFFQKGYEHWDHVFESDTVGKVKYYVVRNSTDEIGMKKIE